MGAGTNSGKTGAVSMATAVNVATKNSGSQKSQQNAAINNQIDTKWFSSQGAGLYQLKVDGAGTVNVKMGYNGNGPAAVITTYVNGNEDRVSVNVKDSDDAMNQARKRLKAAINK